MSIWIGLLLSFASVSPVGQIEADRGRIQRHLAQVEAELRAAPTDHLGASQIAERLRNIDRLHDYWVAGQFPHNTDYTGERVPYFIDDDGRACAVGHLVIESGAADLAARIQDAENNALLGDMRSDGLLEWVKASGLSAQECARIQPAYCDCTEEEAPVCGTNGVTYLNECYATTCAGVEVAYEGVCEGEPTTGFPPPGTSGDDGGESSSTTGAGGAPGTTGEGGSGAPGTTGGGGGDDAGDEGDDANDDGKGCRIGGRPGLPLWFAISILGLAGARVRRRR